MIYNYCKNFVNLVLFIDTIYECTLKCKARFPRIDIKKYNLHENCNCKIFNNFNENTMTIKFDNIIITTIKVFIQFVQTVNYAHRNLHKTQ